MFKIMAENKKSFVLYSDYNEVFNELSDIDAGQLIKHILKYVNDENPITENPIVKVSFIPIKLQLKRDLIKYEDKKEQWSLAGKASAESKRLKKINGINERTTESTNVENVTTESTVTVNDNVTVNVINKIDYEALLQVLNLSFGRSFQVINKKVRSSYEARLKEGYTKEQINNAIENCKKNDYHKENDYQYCTPEFFSRAETLDKYSNVTKQIQTGDDMLFNNVMKQLEAAKNYKE